MPSGPAISEVSCPRRARIDASVPHDGRRFTGDGTTLGSPLRRARSPSRVGHADGGTAPAVRSTGLDTSRRPPRNLAARCTRAFRVRSSPHSDCRDPGVSLRAERREARVGQPRRAASRPWPFRVVLEEVDAAFGGVLGYPSTHASSWTRRRRAERDWPSGADRCDARTECSVARAPGRSGRWTVLRQALQWTPWNSICRRSTSPSVRPIRTSPRPSTRLDGRLNRPVLWTLVRNDSSRWRSRWARSPRVR